MYYIQVQIVPHNYTMSYFLCAVVILPQGVIPKKITTIYHHSQRESNRSCPIHIIPPLGSIRHFKTLYIILSTTCACIVCVCVRASVRLCFSILLSVDVPILRKCACICNTWYMLAISITISYDYHRAISFFFAFAKQTEK